jgi:hypothetical protein
VVNPSSTRTQGLPRTRAAEETKPKKYKRLCEQRGMDFKMYRLSSQRVEGWESSHCQVSPVDPSPPDLLTSMWFVKLCLLFVKHSFRRDRSGAGSAAQLAGYCPGDPGSIQPRPAHNWHPRCGDEPAALAARVAGAGPRHGTENLQVTTVVQGSGTGSGDSGPGTYRDSSLELLTGPGLAPAFNSGPGQSGSSRPVHRASSNEKFCQCYLKKGTRWRPLVRPSDTRTHSTSTDEKTRTRTGAFKLAA